MYPHGTSNTNVRDYSLFHEKVKTKDVPDYYNFVNKKDHVFLRQVLIKTKSSQRPYKDVLEFKKDIDKIVANAKAYNGTNPSTGMPHGKWGVEDVIHQAKEMAEKICKFVDEKIEALHSEDQIKTGNEEK